MGTLRPVLTRPKLHVVRTQPRPRLIRLQRADRAELRAGLTGMEMEVLLWLANGKRFEDIAQIMSIKANAVKRHAFRIRAKIGANTLPGAVAIALRRRIIE